ncbi:MAG: CHAD domain-containing protein [Pirellulales bacterium]
MIETSKWVECDAPGQPAASVVVVALAGRLAVVSHYLEPSLADDVHEIERIHQLRVATRRSGAALAAFAEFLPPGKAKRMRRTLKRIRRAAGAARDIDVMADRYQSPSEAVSDPTHDWLWAFISDARRGARPAVEGIFRRYGRGKFTRQAERLVNRAGWRGEGDEPTFAGLAAEQLGRAARDFFQIARRRPRRAGGLHAMRIAAKRFRYVLELFSGVAEGLRDEVYPLVEQVQQRLGDANDRAVGANQLSVWRRRHARRRRAERGADGIADIGSTEVNLAEVEAIAKRERKKATAARRDFLQWWTVERCESLAQRFEELMASTR